MNKSNDMKAVGWPDWCSCMAFAVRGQSALFIFTLSVLCHSPLSSF